MNVNGHRLEIKGYPLEIKGYPLEIKIHWKWIVCASFFHIYVLIHCPFFDTRRLSCDFATPPERIARFYVFDTFLIRRVVFDTRRFLLDFATPPERNAIFVDTRRCATFFDTCSFWYVLIRIGFPSARETHIKKHIKKHIKSNFFIRFDTNYRCTAAGAPRISKKLESYQYFFDTYSRDAYKCALIRTNSH